MHKNYGPKAFEKEWKKQLKGFNETKIFFNHGKSTTRINYIDGDKLLGVKVYRCQFEIDNWLNHFQHYLDTGEFDTDAYWVTYTSKREDPDDCLSKLTSVYGTEITAVPMLLQNGFWSVHSPEMDKFMKKIRNGNGNIGFKHVSRGTTEIKQQPEIV